ncbi:MAG: hypothetical protein ACM3SY_14585 [Candidatus Omnitrophota bacterium]
MSKIILKILGILHFLVSIFHLWLVNSIPYNENIRQILPLMQIFAFWSCITIFFFAVISLFYTEDMLTTRLGRALLVLIAAFYFIRAFEEYIFFKSFLVIFVPCVIIGLLHIGLIFLPYKPKKPRTY